MVHTIIVDGYNIKFDKIGSIISISIPNYRCEIDTDNDERKFTDEFVTILKICGWKSKAIKKLQLYIFTEDEWDSCVEMDVKSGIISRD